MDKLSSDENRLFSTLGGSGFPFIDFGGKYEQSGTSLDPVIFKGMTPDQVAAAMTDPTTKQGAAIQASADVFTAMICGIDGGQPANVCTASGVTAATKALAAIK